MNCPRCDNSMQNVIEYYTDKNKFVYSKEYYCTRCKSGVIERFDQAGLIGSEWVDFNV